MSEQQKSKGSSTALMVILIILVVVLIGAVVAGIGFIFLYKVGTSGEKPTLTAQIPADTGSSTGTASAPSTSTSPAATAVKEGWQTYENSRYGYSLQVPSTFDKEESANGDGATFTTWDPPMTIRVWGEANSSNLTAQTAIDFDKEDFAKNEAENFQLVSEEDTTMGGLPAVKSVWSYSNPQTGDAIVAAKAYVVRGEAVIKLEFLVDYNAWSEYSTMFDEVTSSFAFK